MNDYTHIARGQRGAKCRTMQKQLLSWEFWSFEGPGPESARILQPRGSELE
jgi:hypothetical protein